MSVGYKGREGGGLCISLWGESCVVHFGFWFTHVQEDMNIQEWMEFGVLGPGGGVVSRDRIGGENGGMGYRWCIFWSFGRIFKG